MGSMRNPVQLAEQALVELSLSFANMFCFIFVLLFTHVLILQKRMAIITSYSTPHGFRFQRRLPCTDTQVVWNTNRRRKLDHASNTTVTIYLWCTGSDKCGTLTSLRRVLMWVPLTIITVNTDLNSKRFIRTESQSTIRCWS